MQVNIQMEEIHRARRVKELQCPLWAPLSQHFHVLTALDTLDPVLLGHWRLHCLGRATELRRINFIYRPSPLWEEVGVGLEVPSVKSRCSPSGDWTLPRGPPRVTSLEQRPSYLPGNYKGFRSLVSGIKDQILEQKLLLVLLC